MNRWNYHLLLYERGESMEKWIVLIQQDDNVVKFRFNEMSDAIEFIQTCAETADHGTIIQLYEDD